MITVRVVNAQVRHRIRVVEWTSFKRQIIKNILLSLQTRVHKTMALCPYPCNKIMYTRARNIIHMSYTGKRYYSGNFAEITCYDNDDRYDANVLF